MAWRWACQLPSANAVVLASIRAAASQRVVDFIATVLLSVPGARGLAGAGPRLTPFNGRASRIRRRPTAARVPCDLLAVVTAGPRALRPDGNPLPSAPWSPPGIPLARPVRARPVRRA